MVELIDQIGAHVDADLNVGGRQTKKPYISRQRRARLLECLEADVGIPLWNDWAISSCFSLSHSRKTSSTAGDEVELLELSSAARTLAILPASSLSFVCNEESRQLPVLSSYQACQVPSSWARSCFPLSSTGLSKGNCDAAFSVICSHVQGRSK